jgi:hypothetical protein
MMKSSQTQLQNSLTIFTILLYLGRHLNMAKFCCIGQANIPTEQGKPNDTMLKPLQYGLSPHLCH